jgi:hypothetical protein
MKTIPEKNKLLALFMNGVLHPESNDHWEAISLDGYIRGTFRISDLMYHQSNDWLASVITKIGELHHEININISEGFLTCTLLAYNDKGENVADFLNQGDDAVYETAVQFVEWYNTQQT